MSTTEEPAVDLLASGREQFKWKHYRRYLKIEDRRTGQLVQFEPNVIQQRISDLIDEKIRAREPVRLIILKSRRMGVSTIIQARFAHFAFASLRWSAVTGAHEIPSASYLHGMVEQMYDALPAPLQRKKATGLHGRRLEFEEGSGLSTFTAGSGEGVGRGTAARGIHASEVAFWGDSAASVLLALRQIVPSEPGTIIAIESTAKGMGNAFHDEWQRAQRGASEYIPLFFAWFEFPDYQMPLDERIPGCRGGVLDPDWWDAEGYEEEAAGEEDVLRGLGCSEEQLAWRRHAIVNQCGEDLDQFRQEYPATAEEAFLSSGRPFFPRNVQARLARVVCDPIGVGDIDGEPIRNATLRFRAQKRGPLHVYERPGRGPYLIGADSAGGISDDEASARQKVGDRTDGDFNAACVIDLASGRTVADFQKKTDADLFAKDLARLGWIYKTADGLPAEIAVESNGQGLLTLSKLRDEWRYPRIYHREALQHEYKGRRTRSIGWVTTASNRGAILANLLQVARDHPEKLPSRRLLVQMQTFVQTGDAQSVRYEHAAGYHDDAIFASAIGYFLFLMRSQFATEFALPRPARETVAELEDFAINYRDTGENRPTSVRALALGGAGRPKR